MAAMAGVAGAAGAGAPAGGSSEGLDTLAKIEQDVMMLTKVAAATAEALAEEDVEQQHRLVQAQVEAYLGLLSDVQQGFETCISIFEEKRATDPRVKSASGIEKDAEQAGEASTYARQRLADLLSQHEAFASNGTAGPPATTTSS